MLESLVAFLFVPQRYFGILLDNLEVLDSPAWVDIVGAAGIAVVDTAVAGTVAAGIAAAGTVVVGIAVVDTVVEEVDILVESLFLGTRFAADMILGIHTIYALHFVVQNRTEIAVAQLRTVFVD